MRHIRRFIRFRIAFFQPGVFAFIFTGTGFMFFTFLTDNKIIELAISAIASIFIGIGVNNYSALGTTKMDERRVRRKTRHTSKCLLHLQLRIKKIAAYVHTDLFPIYTELEEMNDYIELCRVYLKGTDI
jgi:hypothetical protein